ncbi:hypothetical protein PVAND_004196 [Polypedilum vanderplanki]|uniref:Uncharacterized protein n=1 Tax=Polypedilum vanderplanki TaxID=319348 RepID=A0A9J6BWY9_POLVA|nr:hypothetical protein PVAND_004196 [Polypedilum vanderplanki]
MQKIPSGNNIDENAAPISSNDEANESDNGEVYQHNNDFQDQNSSCDPTVSSTIADDMKFDEHHNQNSSPVDVYSRSPSKEQESKNHKKKREWSNSDSPEESYQQQRIKRSKVYRNRSPSLQSPRISRPDSGDEMKKSHLNESDYSDQLMHGDLSTTYCPSSPSMINNNTPIESPTEIMEDELEPILSDDVNGIEELSDEMFAEEFSIKIFNPFIDTLRRIETTKVDDSMKLEKLKEQITKLSDEYVNKYEQEPLTVNESCPTHCEQLIHYLRAINDIKVVDLDLVQTFEPQILNTILSCIKIGLNYSLSKKYHQAGCNVRHLKAGIRLIECFSNNGSFILWIIENQKFNLYQHLFDLL